MTSTLNSLSAWFHEGSKLRRHDRRQLRAMVRPLPVEAGSFRGSNAVLLDTLGPGTELPQLDHVMRRRRSVRQFTGEALGGGILRTLLETGFCVNAGKETGLRPYPSAGGLFPIRIRVWVNDVQGLGAGLYRLNMEGHALERLSGTAPADLANSCFYPGLLQRASFVLVLSAAMKLTGRKYLERGYRYMLLEAGHAAQNALLLAAALGAGATPIGGFIDTEIERAMGMDGVTESLIYLLPVGVCKT